MSVLSWTLYNIKRLWELYLYTRPKNSRFTSEKRSSVRSVSSRVTLEFRDVYFRYLVHFPHEFRSLSGFVVQVSLHLPSVDSLISVSLRPGVKGIDTVLLLFSKSLIFFLTYILCILLLD